jgi:hypothetical protein
MLRMNRLTSALAGRGKAVAAVSAATAVLAGAGAASAVTLTGTTAAAQAATTAAHTAKPAAHAAATAAPKPAAQTVKTAAKAAQAAKATKPATPKAKAKAKAHKAVAKPAAPVRPYQIYDSVTPSAIPAHARIATYADGGYAVSPAQVAHRGHVLWIDTNGADPRASALDVEPGDATPAMAATWAWHKLHAAAGSVAIIYTMRSEWPATQAAVRHLPAPMQAHVRWWIADPTGVNHIVPGASATQWYWGHNYDITTAKPGF